MLSFIKMGGGKRKLMLIFRNYIIIVYYKNVPLQCNV